MRTKLGRPRKKVPKKYGRIHFGRVLKGACWSRGYISEKYLTQYDVKMNVVTGEYWIYNMHSLRIAKQGKSNPLAKNFKHIIARKIKKDLKKLRVPFHVEFRRTKRFQTQTVAQTSDRTAMGVGQS